jgi:hypothetical protein
MIVVERWFGQGDETGGLHTRTRSDPTCEMIGPDGKPCGKPATVRVNEIDSMLPRRYPSDMWWCPVHAHSLAYA